MQAKDNYATLFDQYIDAVVINKAQQYSRWTIPSLTAKSTLGANAQTLEGDYQSEGATLVNSLASKFTTLLFPTTHAFMGFDLNKELLEQLGADPKELDESLATTVLKASQRIFHGKSYHQLNMALKHLIVTGNVCVKRDEERASITAYGIERYVTKRDGDGRVIDAIIKEQVYYNALPEDIKAKVDTKRLIYGTQTNKPLDMYTRIKRLDIKSYNDIPMFETSVQIDGVDLGSEFEGLYTEHRLPYIFATWNLVSGENYGRSHIEDYAGGLAKISALSESLALYGVESLHVTNLVGSASAGSIEDLANADMGEFVRADPNEVLAYETGSTQKIQYIRAEIQAEFTTLAPAFLYRANVRSGDRITAFEIQQQINEVESAMGGAYASIAESLQLPLSYILLYEQDPEIMTLMSEGLGTVQIVTGVNALGKSTKINNLIQAMQEGQALVGIAMQIDKRLDTNAIMDEVYKAHAIDVAWIKKSDEVLKQEAQAMQTQEQGQAEMQQAMVMGQEMMNG